MGNFGADFNQFAQGFVGGYETGQRSQMRALQIEEAEREAKKAKDWEAKMDKLRQDMGLPPRQQKEGKGWFGRLGDAIEDGWALVTGKAPRQQTTTPPDGTATITGGQTSTLDVKREPNVAGGPSQTGVPGRGAPAYGVRTDQQEVGEGVSRSAFGYEPSSAAAPAPTAGPDVQGSSGGVAPPPSTGPSPQARAIADNAVRQVGGRPTQMPEPIATGTAPPGPYGAAQAVPGAGVRPSLPAPRPVVGAEPPGGTPMGPAQPVDEQSRYPRDVGAPARTAPTATATGGIDLHYDPRQQAAPQGSNVLPFRPVTPRGAIDTPDDQRTEGTIIKLANKGPIPKGQRPQDLITAITPKDAPPGTLPTAKHLFDALEKNLPELATVDPERALRLMVQTTEALRSGMLSGMMRAQAAFESGDLQGAQRMLMKTYNTYVLNGTKAQFDVGKDGKSLTMQLYDEQTGEKRGVLTPVTKDLMLKMGLVATSPQALAQYYHWQEQMAQERQRTAAAAGARADAAAARKEALAETKRYHDWQMKLQGEQLALQRRGMDVQERREGRQDDLQRQAAQDTAEARRLQNEERQRRLDTERYRKSGKGYIDPSDADLRKMNEEVDKILDPMNLPAGSKRPSKEDLSRMEAERPALGSAAVNLMAWNNGMTAREAVDVVRRLQRGETATEGRTDDKAGYVEMKLGNRTFAMPITMRERGVVESGPGAGAGATVPAGPGRGTPTTQAPVASAPPPTAPTQGVPGRGQLPAEPPPATLEEMRGRVQQRDQRAAELARRTGERQAADQASQQERLGRVRARLDEIRSSGILQRPEFSGRNRSDAVETLVRQVARETGATEAEVRSLFAGSLGRPPRQAVPGR